MATTVEAPRKQSAWMLRIQRQTREDIRVMKSVKGPSASSETFLVIQTGCEGIERIIGLYDRAGAIERITGLKKRSVQKDVYCIQRVDGDGAKCCCAELGVGPSRRILY